MVSTSDYVGDVALLLASESLVLQLMRSCGPDRAPVLRVVRSTRHAVAGHVLASAAFSIIDATEDPRKALAILEEGIARGCQARIGVYTEIMHEGLEIPVRSLGAALWLGPCSEADWGFILDAVEASTLMSPVASRSLEGSSSILPIGLRSGSGFRKGDLR